MAFPNCKYDLEQEHVPQTGFVVSPAAQVEQMSVHGAVCHGPTDISYLAGSLDDNSLVSRQQGDPQPAAVGTPRHPLHTYPAITGYSGGIPTVPYHYQRIAPHINPDPHHLLYPKPIYSYSILIFMALKNSKTGSLPVSEIYNFMTEHFPYFKTAPDGWKNSVRHNLSLNKCFEKVENKFGGNSRKGCLWALNPSKVQKMQEELQKWRRKDPAAVRKSMAKPDQLDRLIGEKADRTRSPVMVPPPVHLETLLSAQDTSRSGLGHIQPQCLPPDPRPHPHCQGRAQVNTSAGRSQTMPQLHQPQPSRGQADGVLEPSQSAHSPLVGSIPDISSLLHTEHPVARDVQHIPMEGDSGTDIDALNPSLVDFELQGNLWEVLKADSLTLDPLVSAAMSPQSPSLLPFCWTDMAAVTQSRGSDSGPADPRLPEMCAGCPGSGSKSRSQLTHTGCTPVALV
ncbi:forkhead box protein N1-like isoform X2 [Pristis pectinata]|uniref:forkhead box protein N1-like isoform X2 n=1 Tax=Pristis pectinata TaxID=685728 RepID=UPI00223E1808|nr:forkhead box protein N1-like isoform X2 [Pristis pectinata]